MKKTIIITIAMLCVFGAVVMFGASRVSNDWQQPQQDDVEISTVSPIEQVENSIKKYEYDILSKDNIDDFFYKGKKYRLIPEENIFEQTDIKDGMITYAEAISYGGTAVEKIYTDISLDNRKFIIALEKMKTFEEGMEILKTGQMVNSSIYCHYPQYAFIGRNLIGDTYIQYYLDSYTGKILTLCRMDNALFDEDAIISVNHTYSDVKDIEKEKTLLARTDEILEILGYSSRRTHIMYAENIYYGPPEDYIVYRGYTIEILLEDSTVVKMSLYDNETENYPLYRFENLSGYYDEVYVKNTRNDLLELSQEG